ncbi:Uncharacterised protein [Mycobacteroides abscessus subsp. abscessus]|nr:Uncharacterised protein [Mycobacteroides abscessus subsp. abscessus]
MYALMNRINRRTKKVRIPITFGDDDRAMK